MQQQAEIDFTNSPHLLSDEEAVLSCLGHGRQAATSSTIIEARTGLKPRRVQQVVRKLRLEGYGIGSATQEPMGYYITDAQDENADMARKLRARGIKVLMVAARFSKRSLRMEFDNAVMEMEGERCKL